MPPETEKKKWLLCFALGEHNIFPDIFLEFKIFKLAIRNQFHKNYNRVERDATKVSSLKVVTLYTEGK